MDFLLDALLDPLLDLVVSSMSLDELISCASIKMWWKEKERLNSIRGHCSLMIQLDPKGDLNGDPKAEKKPHFRGIPGFSDFFWLC